MWDNKYHRIPPNPPPSTLSIRFNGMMCYKSGHHHHHQLHLSSQNHHLHLSSQNHHLHLSSQTVTYKLQNMQKHRIKMRISERTDLNLAVSMIRVQGIYV